MTDSAVYILLVEDSPPSAFLVKELLKFASGYIFLIECVETLSAALHSLQRFRFDVVLLDLSLPDSDGLETLAAVRHYAPGLPIIVMSGFEDPMTARQAVALGASEFLPKGSVDSDSLISAVTRVPLQSNGSTVGWRQAPAEPS